jgi:hypothetical protein
MTALLNAIARAFVAPSPQARVEPIAVAAPAAAVCGRDGEPVAAALALMLRARGPVVVCAWGAAGRHPTVPAGAAARRLAGSLRARGLAAHATGRLVAVSLDDAPSVAAAEVARASAAAGDAPVVTALCGPRDPAFDDLLAAQDVAVVVAGDAPDALVSLGVARLAESSRRAVAVARLAAASAWAARAGLCATPSARRALVDARADPR